MNEPRASLPEQRNAPDRVAWTIGIAILVIVAGIFALLLRPGSLAPVPSGGQAGPEGPLWSSFYTEVARILGISSAGQATAANSLPVVISSDQVDDVNSNIVVVDTVHAEVHEGEMYYVAHSADMADDTGRHIWFRTGANTAHFALEVAGGGELSISMWETPTLTGGTLLTLQNMKRDSVMSATSVVSHTPGVGVSGTAMFTNLIIPGGTKNNTRVGGSARPETEWILAANRSHLIEVWCTAGATVSTTVQMNWYEE